MIEIALFLKTFPMTPIYTVEQPTDSWELFRLTALPPGSLDWLALHNLRAVALPGGRHVQVRWDTKPEREQRRLHRVLHAAETCLEDIDTGLQDGTYVENENPLHGFDKLALADLKTELAALYGRDWREKLA